MNFAVPVWLNTMQIILMLREHSPILVSRDRLPRGEACLRGLCAFEVSTPSSAKAIMTASHAVIGVGRGGNAVE